MTEQSLSEAQDSSAAEADAEQRDIDAPDEQQSVPQPASTADEREPGWFAGVGSGRTTLVLMGLTATVSQLLAMQLSGLQLSASTRALSTGGVLAVVSALAMWRFAPTWQRFRRGIWIPLTAMVVTSFVVVGLTNSYKIEVEDSPYIPATQSWQYTGVLTIEEGDGYLCKGGEDYWNCVNEHRVMYNSVCADQVLTAASRGVCSELSDFVDRGFKRYKSCGYGCETKGDEKNRWGWKQLRLRPEQAFLSDNNEQWRQAHVEYCHFDIGIIRIGSCDRDARIFW